MDVVEKQIVVEITIAKIQVCKESIFTWISSGAATSKCFVSSFTDGMGKLSISLMRSSVLPM
jgi:hypothetical protein